MDGVRCMCFDDVELWMKTTTPHNGARLPLLVDVDVIKPRFEALVDNMWERRGHISCSVRQ